MCNLKYIQGPWRINTQPIRVDGYWGDETQRAMIGIQSHYFTSTLVGDRGSLADTYHGTYQPGSRALMDFSYQGNGYQFCWGGFYHG